MDSREVPSRVNSNKGMAVAVAARQVEGAEAVGEGEEEVDGKIFHVSLREVFLLSRAMAGCVISRFGMHFMHI